MLWVCNFLEMYFADPRPPGISATVVLCLIINNLIEVALYSWRTQASS